MPPKSLPPLNVTFPDDFILPPGYGMGYMGPHEQPAFLEEHMMPSMLEVYDAQRTRAQASLSNPSRHVSICYISSCRHI